MIAYLILALCLGGILVAFGTYLFCGIAGISSRMEAGPPKGTPEDWYWHELPEEKR